MTRTRHNPLHFAKYGAVASVLAGACLSAQALSLGHVSLESGLGEPLRVAIEITQYKVEDLRKLKVQLAEPSSFEQSGMSFNPALKGIQLRLEFRGDGKPYIALSGLTPVNDHFVDLIVEAQWPSGLLAMNYTLLVSAVDALKSTSDKPKAQESIIAPAVSAQATPNVAAPMTDSTSKAGDDTLLVRAGDTASKLMRGKMPPGISLDQMLLAMVRANPEAFIEGNVNLLREGAQIRLPSADEATQVSAEDARKNVIAQTANFVAYARRLAQSALKATDTPSREMTGKVSAELPAPEQAAPAQDKLTLSKRDGSTDGTEAKLAIEREAQDKTEQLTALKKDLEALESLSATTAAKPEDKSSSNPSATQAARPPVAQQAKGLSLLETMGRTLPIWAWLGALFAAMAGLVWWVRRRRTLIGQDLFATSDTQSPMPIQVSAPSVLPDQLAHLDLNLTPVPDTTQAPQAPNASAPAP